MTAWHLDRDLTDRYVSGGLDIVLAASVESHVLRCARCQQALSAALPQDRLNHIWDAVIVEIDSSPPRPMQRLLARLGTLMSTPSRWAAGAAGAALAAGFVLVLAITNDQYRPPNPPAATSPSGVVVGPAAQPNPRQPREPLNRKANMLRGFPKGPE